jgi:hypothetical protein
MDAMQGIAIFPLAVKVYAFLLGMAGIPHRAKSAGKHETSKQQSEERRSNCPS